MRCVTSMTKQEWFALVREIEHAARIKGADGFHRDSVLYYDKAEPYSGNYYRTRFSRGTSGHNHAGTFLECIIKHCNYHLFRFETSDRIKCRYNDDTSVTVWSPQIINEDEEAYQWRDGCGFCGTLVKIGCDCASLSVNELLKRSREQRREREREWIKERQWESQEEMLKTAKMRVRMS